MELALKDFSFAYQNKKNILDNINLKFSTQEFITILGPNGAGKSTLLQALVGLNKPTSGQLLLNQTPIKYSSKELISLRTNVQLLFQNPDDQIVLDDPLLEISFGLLNLGLDQDEVKKRVDTIVKDLEIDKLMTLSINEMSYGQKKLIALASIMVMNPKIILLDEPTTGLDNEGIKNLFKVLMQLKKQYDLTIIISTHELEAVLPYSSRYLILNNQKIIFDGNLEQLMSNEQMLIANNIALSNYLKLCLIFKKQHPTINDFSYVNMQKLLLGV